MKVQRSWLAGSRQGFGLVSGAAILWGTIGVATQGLYEVDSTTPIFINLARMLIATPLLLVFCWRILGRKLFDIQRNDLALMLFIGLLIVFFQVTYSAAIQYVGVTISTLLTLCVAPIIVAGESVLLKMERLTSKLIAALVLALVGSVLLVGFQSPDEVHQDVVRGVVYSLLSASGYASMIVCGRFLAGSYHPLQVTTINFCAGTVVLLVVNLVGGVAAAQTVEGWMLLVYLALVPSALAYWLFQAGMRSVSATAASIITLLEPLTAAVLAWFWFGETLQASGIVGVVLLVISFVILVLDQPASEKTVIVASD